MKNVPGRIKWIFAVGQLGWSILSGIVANLLVNFYLPDSTGEGVITFVTSATFLGLTVIGIITACGRLVDAVTDPWIASMSDNCGSKLGKRIPFMRYSAFPFALVTVLIFCCPVRGVSVINVVWLAITMILFYIFMTAYCTPFNALIPVLGRNQKDRMDISTYIQYMGRTVDEFREDMKISAFRRVKNRMMIRAIANQENITASDEEVEKQLNDMAEQNHIDVEKLKEYLGGENLKAVREDVRIQKAIDLLYENAKIVPKKEDDKKAEKAEADK